jgi:hypothetical protein
MRFFGDFSAVVERVAVLISFGRWVGRFVVFVAGGWVKVTLARFETALDILGDRTNVCWFFLSSSLSKTRTPQMARRLARYSRSLRGYVGNAQSTDR